MFPGAGYCKGFYVESVIKKVASGFKMEAKQLSEPIKYLCLIGRYLEKVNTFILNLYLKKNISNISYFS